MVKEFGFEVGGVGGDIADVNDNSAVNEVDVVDVVKKDGETVDGALRLAEVARLRKVNRQLRRWILQMTTAAGSGHPSSSLSAVELMSSLMFGRVDFAQNSALVDEIVSGEMSMGEALFRFDVNYPDNPTNDRLIFSKGHAAPLYYALWAVAGVIDEEELMTLRKFNSVLEGHPTRRFGLTEVPTGSLGQGLSVGVGMALHARDIAQTAARVFVLLGDSEMAEGQVWEAMALAAHYKLANLVAIVDVNRLGQRGATMLGWDLEAYRARAEAFGWRALVVDDGHDIEQVLRSLDQFAQNDGGKPTMIIAQTVKGEGVSFVENADNWHGKALSPEQLEEALVEVGEVDDFAQIDLSLPDVDLNANNDSIDNIAQSSNEDAQELELTSYEVGELVAPRDAYGNALAVLAQIDERVVALDAETSNSTRADQLRKVLPERFFECFIAEQNMVSMAVGMSRRGSLPFVSTFGAFLTRAADQIRMAQYARVPLVLVGSHAGVSIGVDGSSQMALEDMSLFSSLRESVMLYPADAPAMAECVMLAARQSGITYLRSTRGKLPVIYDEDEEFEVGGSKVLRKSDDDKVVIISAGITLHEALAAADKLADDGVVVGVIDCYSVRPLDEEAVVRAIGATARVVVVEDHYENGGLGGVVARVIAQNDVRCEFAHLCVRREPRSGTPEQLLEYEEIDRYAIIQAVRKMIKS